MVSPALIVLSLRQLFIFLHGFIKPPCKENTDNISDDTNDRENSCDRGPFACSERHRTQQAGPNEERDDHQRPDRPLPCQLTRIRILLR